MNDDDTTTHKQVEASRATVDEGIAELLECLWAAEITTTHSCQGGEPDDDGSPRPAMIMFPTVDDALRFMLATMKKSHWYNRLTLRLADPQYDLDAGDFGPVRASVAWPAEDRWTGSDVTAELTDAWAGRQREDDLFARRPPREEL